MKSSHRSTEKGQNVTSIVIDDDVDLRDVFVELLEIHHIAVLGTGKNGYQALGLYKKFHPDLVFLDEFMPDYDGFYGLKQIRKYDHLSKIILVTAATERELKFDKNNITAMIEKPIEIDKVMLLVEKMMSGKNL